MLFLSLLSLLRNFPLNKMSSIYLPYYHRKSVLHKKIFIGIEYMPQNLEALAALAGCPSHLSLTYSYIKVSEMFYFLIFSSFMFPYDLCPLNVLTFFL